MKVAILGAGNLGTTLALMMSRKGHRVSIWTVEEDVYESLLTLRENPRYLPGYIVPPEVDVTMELEEAVREADALILALPSHVIREVTRKLVPHLSDGQLLIDFAKGMEVDTEMRMSEVIRSELPHGKEVGIVAVSGPSIAAEMVKGQPTAVEVSSFRMEDAYRAKEILETPSFRLHPNEDLVGVELGGVFKNVFAIGAGICDGLGMGVNTKAALVTRSLREFALLGEVLGARPETFKGLSGLGDLIVTCFSPHSRNRRFGEKLGEGLGPEEAQEEIGQVVEGIRATEVAHKIGQKHKLHLPIVERLYEIIFNGADPRERVYEFLR